MSIQYALVENGIVVNVVLWDGESEWTPPTGQQAVTIPDGSEAAIGWTYDGTNFTPPA